MNSFVTLVFALLRATSPGTAGAQQCPESSLFQKYRQYRRCGGSEMVSKDRQGTDSKGQYALGAFRQWRVVAIFGNAQS